MRREILFRGRSCADGEWVEGGYFELHGIVYICWVGAQDWGMVKVMPETVGQYVGKKDAEGRMIFDGDIIDYGGATGIVMWSEAGCNFYIGTYKRPDILAVWGLWWKEWEKFLVKGNIHEERYYKKKEE